MLATSSLLSGERRPDILHLNVQRTKLLVDAEVHQSWTDTTAYGISTYAGQHGSRLKLPQNIDDAFKLW